MLVNVVFLMEFSFGVIVFKELENGYDSYDYDYDYSYFFYEFFVSMILLLMVLVIFSMVIGLLGIFFVNYFE